MLLQIPGQVCLGGDLGHRPLSGLVDYGVFSFGGRQVLRSEVSVISQIFILLEVEGEIKVSDVITKYF